MKKLVVVAAVLVALLGVGPWGVGKLAEKRLDHGLDKLVEAAPYLTVVERKYTPGWFKSEQVVTFEAFGPWMKTLEKAMSKPEVEVETETAAEAVPAEEPAALADVPKLGEMTRFTVRNEVLHGPVLGLSGFGIARVDSHLVLSDEMRKKLEEVFGPKSPVEVSTRIGFLGGGTTTFKSEGRTIKPRDSKAEITWDTVKLAIGYSKNADDYDVDGKWPKLEVSNRTNNSKFVMTNLTLDGGGERVRGDLYDGDLTFEVDQFTALGKEGENVEINDLQYILSSESKGEFTVVSARMGLGKVKAKEFSALGIEIKEVHNDASVRRLHTETLVKILADFKAMYAKPLSTTLEASDIMFAPLKEQGMALLKHDPEYVIERLGIETPDGDGYIKGVIKLKGATAEDFGSGSMSIIGKIDADITIDVSEKMIQKFPNGSTGAGAAVDSGYARRDGDRLICRIVFAKGQLTVNGKPQAIPGLGGPPPGAMEEAPPPQE